MCVVCLNGILTGYDATLLSQQSDRVRLYFLPSATGPAGAVQQHQSRHIRTSFNELRITRSCSASPLLNREQFRSCKWRQSNFTHKVLWLKSLHQGLHKHAEAKKADLNHSALKYFLKATDKHPKEESDTLGDTLIWFLAQSQMSALTPLPYMSV